MTMTQGGGINKMITLALQAYVVLWLQIGMVLLQIKMLILCCSILLKCSIVNATWMSTVN